MLELTTGLTVAETVSAWIHSSLGLTSGRSPTARRALLATSRRRPKNVVRFGRSVSFSSSTTAASTVRELAIPRAVFITSAMSRPGE